MKWMVALSMLLAVACNDSDDQSDVEAAPNTPGVQNVNGNIPDTSNSIQLNGMQPVDSSRVDSTRK